MQAIFKSLLAATAATLALQAGAQAVFYSDDNFAGQSFTAERSVDNFRNYGFNDRASSVVVVGNRWEVCDDAGYAGHCVVLRQGRYPSLREMGLNDRVSSVRSIGNETRIEDGRYAPASPLTEDYRQRGNERLYQANVTSVRAVVGQDQQRCWVEREQVDNSPRAHPGGAIVGGLLGGILGHQIGGGFGRDVATAGGVVAGAVVGSRVAGRADERRNDVQPVQRCETVPGSAKPAYWDVTYTFHGVEHRVQPATPPGRIVSVNRDGEPRA